MRRHQIHRVAASIAMSEVFRWAPSGTTAEPSLSNLGYPSQPKTSFMKAPAGAVGSLTASALPVPMRLT